jgi:hypothetical protein
MSKEAVLTALAKAITALEPMRCGDDPWQRENTYEHGLTEFGRKCHMRDAEGFLVFLERLGFEVREIERPDAA